MRSDSLRVALFPDAYLEVDGVAVTSRRFEDFARRHNFPLLLCHAGPKNAVEISGSVTRIQLRRGPIGFNLDRAHDYDLLFLRHFEKLAAMLREFRPDVVQITGPSDVGIVGACLAYKLRIPLAASWQTNLHLYARMRAAAALSFLPGNLSAKLLSGLERGALAATLRFYQWPALLFAPNQELIELLKSGTGRPCLPMPHAVDTGAFNPSFRDRRGGAYRIGYVGRLTTEKNVRWLARLEAALLAFGHHNFEIMVVGQGAEDNWLRSNMKKAQFTGVLSGEALSRAFANMDLFVFPSETDSFGLVVLEALSSGVPVVVTSRGGPKFSVRHGETGYIAANFEEFAAFTAQFLAGTTQLSAMRLAARQHALSTSWEQIFQGMYAGYRTHLLAGPGIEGAALRAGHAEAH